MSNTTNITVNPFENCTSVTPQCPVSATTYGYYPSLSGNAALLTIFILVSLSQLALAIYSRLPSFGTVLTLGCVGEVIGYVGRLLMHANPWSDTAFDIQIVCLIIAPSFLAAGIYLTLKHIVMALGPELSRLPAKWYTRIFISCDAFSILVQAVGGGLASAGSGSLQNTGNDLMIAGIAIQVATMGVCLVLAVDFGWALLRSRRSEHGGGGDGRDGVSVVGISLVNKSGVYEKVDGRHYSTTRRFQFYLSATAVAFVLIFIRCIYRLPEMAGGWGSPLMQDETDFMVLDGAMIALACILMTVAHPGIFFPEMRTRKV